MPLPTGEGSTGFPGRDREEQGLRGNLMGATPAVTRNSVLNARERAAAERLALNTPMQGTGADIIKRAMIEVQKAILSGQIPRRNFSCRFMMNCCSKFLKASGNHRTERFTPDGRSRGTAGSTGREYWMGH